MIIVNGKVYHTTIDAAAMLGVSAKTVRDYIKKGILPEPPLLRQGIRVMKHFPPEYIEEAKKLLAAYQSGKRAKP